LIAPLFLSIPNVDTKQRDGVFSPRPGEKDRKLRFARVLRKEQPV